jgi:hypothetical protein
VDSVFIAAAKPDRLAWLHSGEAIEGNNVAHRVDEAKLRGIYPDQYVEEEERSPIDISYLTDDQKQTLLDALCATEAAKTPDKDQLYPEQLFTMG